MPTRPASPCTVATCPNRKPCPLHGRAPDTRPSATARGYGWEWRKVRAEVLRQHGIPEAEWHLWDVDHSPRYDPANEPDHRRYTLTPRLHGEHSRKTATSDGGFGNKRSVG